MPPSDTQHYLSFKNVRKTYDQKTWVVNDFCLTVRAGEFVTLLGPSGSGKTTILMMLAGFEHVSGGTISLEGQSIHGIPPHKRNIGVVFQNYALFPHMTVAQNLAYPLKIRGMSTREIRSRVDRFLALIDLSDFAQRHPALLSGGQRQRVALARALIFEPSLVLMDEPLGALDKKLREQMQIEIMRLHKALGFTVIYVTHDQTEALTMSDRIAIFNEGVVQQFARPSRLYEHPANAFVAGFIGENNFIAARCAQRDDDRVLARMSDGRTIIARNGNWTEPESACVVSVRPEKLVINHKEGFENHIEVRFIARHYVGDFIRYFFKVDDVTLSVKLLNDERAPDFSDGQTATLSWMAADCFAFCTTAPGPASQENDHESLLSHP